MDIVGLLWARDDPKDLGTLGVGYRHGGRPNAACGARHCNSATVEWSEFAKAFKCGDAGQPQGGHVVGIKSRRDKRGGGRSHYHILRITPGPFRSHTPQTLHHRDHAIALAKFRYGRSRFNNLAHDLQTGRVGKRFRPTYVPIAGSYLEV